MSSIDRLSAYLKKELIIGGKTIKNRLTLAPMAGLGHIALRELISEFKGFGLLFTGMCSAKAVPHENSSISPVFRWRQTELPYLVCQIFGSEPESMILAAQRIEKEGFFGVDLNFGCSVAAICKKGSGAALLKTPQLACDIVKSVKASVSIPVFAKFRTGWKNDPSFAVKMASLFEESGADALTFHPRVAPDRRSRPPIWDHIAQVQNAVSIPVFGNGNLFEPSDGLKMLEQTQCQGLSIGRMAVAKPWLFAQWTENLIPEKDIYRYTALRMIHLLAKHYEEIYAVKMFKKFAPYFCANFKFGHNILKKMIYGDTLVDLKQNVEMIFQDQPEILQRPNLNLFS
ncbi:MAG: tRNA-dihydrouridine synthase family protein [Desulfobacteraceae bacterium]|nr:tRNA-dihydrouridine synthase family protein [Desulfobacteraceae bacterium]